MKALSILQPWASLIICGAKDVENRTWPTKHRGPLAVHAGKRYDKGAVAGARRIVDDLVALAADDARSRGVALAMWTALDVAPSLHGGLVGVVDVVDCVRGFASPWAAEDCWHWVLANPRKVDFAPMNGRLGIFNIEVAS